MYNIMQRGGWESDGTLKNVYRHVLEDKETEMNDLANKHFESLFVAKDATQNAVQKNKSLE